MASCPTVSIEAKSSAVPQGVLIVALALLSLMVVISYASRLSWGLWLDETFTAWHSENVHSGPVQNPANPGQPVLYAYVASLFYHPATQKMELLLRIPSVLGALLSCFFVYQLGESLL